MAVIVQGKLGNEAEVDSNNNLEVNLPSVVEQAGYVAVAGEADPGSRVTRVIRQSNTDDDYRFKVGVDTVLFQHVFNAVTGTNWGAGSWSVTALNLVYAVGNGVITLNSTNLVAAGNYDVLRTYRTFPVYGNAELYVEIWAEYEINGTAPNSKNIVEIGIGLATTTAAPTDGCFFRWGTSGNFSCVAVNNSVELTSGTIASPAVNTRHHFIIVLAADSVEYWVDDILYWRQTLTTESFPVKALNLPLLARQYVDSGGAAAGVQLKLFATTVSVGDIGASRPWVTMMAGMGAGAYQQQAGFTLVASTVSTCNWLNSVVPAAATLSSSTAGYTTLGGQFSFVEVAAAETDYALFGYQVPAGSATVPGKNLYVTQVRIHSWGGVVAAGASAECFQWGIAVGSSAVSLNTVETPGTSSAPRRVPLGLQVSPGLSPVGQMLTPAINVEFSSPLFAPAGTFVHVFVKCLGANTATRTLRGLVSVYGFWE